MYDTEKKVAEKAERLLENSLRNKIHGVGFNLGLDDNKASLADARAVSNMTRANESGQDWKIMANQEFRKLSIEMEKHGFIQHYGANTTRENIKGRIRKIPQTTTYNFKNHFYNLPAKDFIGKAINDSGVIPFVLENVTRIRAQQIFLNLKNFIEKG